MIDRRNTYLSGGLLFLVLMACQTNQKQMGQCPQPRFTDKAPEEYYARINPLTANQANIDAGRELYQHSASKSLVACARCHGTDGDGIGPMSHMFDPPPRNFTCAKTINNVPDGQLFWIIKYGSPGTSMPSFSVLKDEEIWQILVYIRRLANGEYH
jgi:mono/diheme cytochrome c family protein